MERSVLQGLAVFRWAAWAWMCTVLVLSREDLAEPGLAVGLVAVALGVTASATYLLRSRCEALLEPGVIVSELAVGFALVLCDGWAYGEGHAFSTSQSLGSVWPLAGVLSAGVAFGPRAGLAGAAMGLGRVGSVLANGADFSDNANGKALSLTSTVVFYVLAAATAGYVFRLLRDAERQISTARAREEVARTLHDGVLQTLAVVERRADDPQLARLAREQERELREYLFGVQRTGGSDLGTALRAAAARFEDVFGGAAQVVVADDVPVLGPPTIEVVAGAVGEAMTNAGKHGSARRVTVYVEPGDDGGVFCSVKDDGSGFDPALTAERIGLSRSIRGRVEEAGGRVEIASRPGAGTEVCLWLP